MSDLYGLTNPPACLPFEADMDCCGEWENHEPGLQDRALALAWNTLRGLTGGLVGGCPVAFRPMLGMTRCNSCVAESCVGNSMTGYEWLPNERWATGACACGSEFDIDLPGRAASITSVMIDGSAVDLSTFNIVNGTRLVRMDGTKWPATQDLRARPDQSGTVEITYLPGVMPGEDGLWAAGILACEFARACAGGKCRLPTAVASMVRNGVSWDIPTGMFDQGTQIREVDAYVHSVNPNRLSTPARVWTPDMVASRHEVTTWSGQ